VTVTVFVTGGLPAVVVNSTTALRSTEEAFVWAVKVTEPSPDPCTELAVNQTGKPVTFHDVFDSIATDNVFASAFSDQDGGETVSVGAASAWVTVMVRVSGGLLDAVNVTMSLRGSTDGFA